jgi:hypothetical protein
VAVLVAGPPGASGAALPAGFASHHGQFELLVVVPVATVVVAVTAHHLAARHRDRAAHSTGRQ